MSAESLFLELEQRELVIRRSLPSLPEYSYNSYVEAICEVLMKSVNIADLKNNLSRYLNDVRQGEEVLVKDRNTPVARIVPFIAESEDEEIMELAARGLISLPQDEGFPKNFFTQPLPKVKSVDVLKMLREERDER